MSKRVFAPELKTDPSQRSKEERNKEAGRLVGTLDAELRDEARPDLSWEAEQLAKSHGLYLEFNRASTGTEKDWIYMIRVGNPGGGPISAAKWRLLDELSEAHTRDHEGVPSLRLTTRQAIQLHYVKKPAVIEIVRRLAESGLYSLNACGDNVRNVIACPLSHGSPDFDGHALARAAGEYFRLPLAPFLQVFAIDPAAVERPAASYGYGAGLLNRKFKIGIGAAHRDPATGRLTLDNCVEALTNDLSVVPVIEDDRVSRLVVCAGGGQGERNNTATTAMLGLPLGAVEPDRVLEVLSAVVKVHEEWGDRKNRHWARLKYVVRKMGIEWLRAEVEARLGARLEPVPAVDPGPRRLHHGWETHHGRASFGAFVENGRLSDHGPNGRLKSMVRAALERFPGLELAVTPNQDLLFTNVTETARAGLEATLAEFGHGARGGRPYSRLRLLSGACVGLPTCRLSYTDSERLEPELIDELEARGLGEAEESIGITGCERQCFRPATKTLGLVGSGFDVYQLKLFGDVEARTQGVPLVSSDGQRAYLRQIPRARLADVIETLLRWRDADGSGTGLGEFLRARGPDGVIAHLKAATKTADLMTKEYRPADPVP